MRKLLLAALLVALPYNAFAGVIFGQVYSQDRGLGNVLITLTGDSFPERVPIGSAAPGYNFVVIKNGAIVASGGGETQGVPQRGQVYGPFNYGGYWLTTGMLNDTPVVGDTYVILQNGSVLFTTKPCASPAMAPRALVCEKR